MKIQRAEWAFVVALLVFAAALRIVGISYGQPDAHYDPSYAPKGLVNPNLPIHPDEFLFITRPLEMLLTGKLNPKFFHNPSFLIDLNFVTFALTNAGDGLSMADRDPATVSGRSFAPFHLYVIGRGYSALGGLLAVAATYGLARRLAGRWGAAAAGLLTAAALPLVQHAHYTTTSSLAAGFTAVAVWASFAALYGQGRRRAVLFVLAGAAAGLAAGCRYNAAAVAIIVFLCGLLLLYRERMRRTLLIVLAGWLAVPFVFLLTTPWVIADTAFFLEEFRFITAQYIAGEGIAFTTSPWHGLLLEYRYLALFGVGAAGAAAAVIGVIAAFGGRSTQDSDKAGLEQFLRRNTLVLFVSVLWGYLLPYSLVALRTARPSLTDQMLVPVLPQFALLAGIGARWIILRLPAPRYSAPLLITGLAVVPLVLSLQVVSLFAQRDTRYVMQAWVYAHVPEGAHIHLVGPYNVPLDPAVYTVTQSFADKPMIAVAEIRALGAAYMIISDAWYHDALRAGEVLPAAYQAEIHGYLAGLEATLTRAAWIERPRLIGDDWLMHTASYWHQPGLTLYCLTEQACAALR